MLSKNEIKFIRNLSQKKFRQSEGFFVAEGVKLVTEMLTSDYKLYKIYSTEAFKNKFKSLEIELITQDELIKISNLVTPNEVLAIFYTKNEKFQPTEDLVLALDDINDPGNLGTIIRLCDWFGVRQIVCSMNTVDVYNQKVVQATMGSLSRVKVIYTDLYEFLTQTDAEIFATTLQGKNIYTTSKPQKTVLIVGNEANGIQPKILALVKNHITIPAFGTNPQTESLNVANATAIVLNEWRRNSDKLI